MLSFHDSAAAINEPKTARMEQRTKPSVKAEIQKAVTLLGIDETTFVISATLDRARSIIADHERTILTAKDRDVILAALDNPPEPTEGLRQAMAIHKAAVAYDG